MITVEGLPIEEEFDSPAFRDKRDSYQNFGRFQACILQKLSTRKRGYTWSHAFGSLTNGVTWYFTGKSRYMNLSKEQEDLLNTLLKQVAELKQVIQLKVTENRISESWVPRQEVMKYLNYGDTQMGALEKSGQITVAKVGKRKFVHRDSIVKLIENNIQQFSWD